MKTEKFLLAALVYVFLAVSDVEPNASQESGTDKHEKNRLIKAMNRLEGIAKKTSGYAKYKELILETPGIEQLYCTHEVAVLGDRHMRWIQETEEEKGLKTIQVMNPTYAFVLAQRDGGDYSLMAVQKIGQSAADDLYIKKKMVQAFEYPFFAYSFYQFPVWNLIGHPNFKLEKIQSAFDESGMERIRVDFEFSPQQEIVSSIDYGVKECHIVFDPVNDWKMVSYGRGHYYGNDPSQFTDPRQVRTVDVYPEGKLAFTDLCEVFFNDGKPPLKVQGKVVRIESSYEPIPHEEFYLSYYGFPEPNFGAKRYWLWIACGLLLGGGCLVASRRILRH